MSLSAVSATSSSRGVGLDELALRSRPSRQWRGSRPGARPADIAMIARTDRAGEQADRAIAPAGRGRARRSGRPRNWSGADEMHRHVAASAQVARPLTMRGNSSLPPDAGERGTRLGDGCHADEAAAAASAAGDDVARRRGRGGDEVGVDAERPRCIVQPGSPCLNAGAASVSTWQPARSCARRTMETMSAARQSRRQPIPATIIISPPRIASRSSPGGTPACVRSAPAARPTCGSVCRQAARAPPAGRPRLRR